MQNLLFSFGSLFFSFLLTIVYFIKAKQTTIDNKIFKTLLIILNLTVISEIVAVAVIYYYPDKVFIGELLARINWILTISWIMDIAWYVLTIGTAYKITDYRKYIIKNKDFRILLYIYVISVVISLFIEFNNYSDKHGAYISGPALYLMYIVGFIAILSSTINTIRGNKKVPKDKIIPIVIGIIVSSTAMVLQRIFPMYLMLTSMFTFDTYIIYFIFENPDLFVIKELDIARSKAEYSDRSKTELLSNMAHEVRTPINSILGFSEDILLDKDFSIETAKKDALSILSAGDNMLEIINNILDVSKIETEEEQVENKEYSLENVITDLKSIIEARLITDKVEFILEVAPETPAKLLGDRNKLFQILLNVLSNSVKYTEVGRIKLKITSQIQNNNVLLNFKISDTGYGIKKEDYNKIFEKFSRLDIATQKEIDGTGLGLLITKKLVDLLGGKIWFESEYGAGSIFYIDITQGFIDDIKFDSNSLQGDLDTNKKTYLDCSNYKVLLVDDDELNIKVTKEIFSNYKFNIKTLTNGEDCINDIKRGSTYDLIFLDHVMPDIDGIETLQVLRKLDGYDIPPVVVLTANTANDIQDLYYKEGFDEYLSKPISITELDKIVNKYFNK